MAQLRDKFINPSGARFCALRLHVRAGVEGLNEGEVGDFYQRYLYSISQFCMAERVELNLCVLTKIKNRNYLQWILCLLHFNVEVERLDYILNMELISFWKYYRCNGTVLVLTQ